MVHLNSLPDFLFVDDAAGAAHSAKDLQQLMTRFSEACRDFGLTSRLKKTQVMGQDVDSPPSISISDHELDDVQDFVFLGFTISDSLSLSRHGAQQAHRQSSYDHVQTDNESMKPTAS